MQPWGLYPLVPCTRAETAHGRQMTQALTPYRRLPSEPCVLTASAAAAVADTMVRTVELGVTITDVAVDGEAMCRWSATRCASGYVFRATGA